MQGFAMGDMPTANHVWGNYLRNKGFSQIVIEDDCNNCFNVKIELCSSEVWGHPELPFKGKSNSVYLPPLSNVHKAASSQML